MKNFLLGLLFVFPLSIFAQQPKISFELKSEINKANNKDAAADVGKISVFIRGNVDEIKKEVQRLGGTVGLSAYNTVSGKVKREFNSRFI